MEKGWEPEKMKRGRVKGFKGGAGGILRCFLVALLCAMLCTIFSAMLSGCAVRDNVPAVDVLCRILDAEENPPSGVIYRKDAAEGETGYLSDALCTALYGDGDLPSEFQLLSDYALFMTATAHPCELAVFRCFSGNDTGEIAEMCEKRLRVLRRYWQGSEYESYTANGRVIIYGNYVLFLISASPDDAFDAAREALS